MEYNVLITAIGGDIGQSIARILRYFNQISCLIGTDVNDNNAGPYFVDKFVLVPRATDKEYVSTLTKIAKENDISCIIPTSEIEIQVLNQHLSDNKSFIAPLIMANQNAINICFDKYKTIKFLEANDINVPWTVLINQEPKGYPCILKNRTGAGSKNVVIIEQKGDWQYHREKRKDAILQELLLPDDSEYTCGVYRGSNETTECIIMRRVLKNDVTGIAEVVEDESIQDLCFKVAELLDLKGAINIQLRKTESGPRIFEINPRFSSTVLFRHNVNFCDLIWSIEDTLSIKLIDRNQPVKYGMKIYRYYREVFKYEDKFFEY